jgi:hypothetical protein
MMRSALSPVGEMADKQRGELACCVSTFTRRIRDS